MTRNLIAFLGSDPGRAAVGLFAGVICFCFPELPGYGCGAVCLYYCIHKFRPVAAWIYEDIRSDLTADLHADEAVAGGGAG